MTRLVTAVNNRDGGKGLIFNRKNEDYEYEDHEFLELRNTAKKAYALLKKQTINNPLFGVIEVTRLGWRHISRESRWYYYKTASYEAILILDKILGLSPAKHYIIKNIENETFEYCFRENEFLLRYNNIKVFDKAENKLLRVDVYVKLIEICSYVKEWKQKPAYTMQTKRRVIFKSIFYKQSSQNMHA